MRIIIIALMLLAFTVTHAQTLMNTAPLSSFPAADSTPNHKWFLTPYAGISTGITFYKGGSSSFLLAPFSLQLNRAINNNLYAFANVTAAPVFSGISPFGYNFNKSSQYYPYRKFGTYSSASLGLMYVNDARTFSISGSIGVERNIPLFPFYTGNNQAPAITPAR